MRFLACVLLACLAVPFGASGLHLHQDVHVTATSRPAFAPLSRGDAGSAVIGVDGALASVRVSALLIGSEDDVLDVRVNEPGWNVRAQLLSFSGFGGLLLLPATLTLSLRDDSGTQQQIKIHNGAVQQQTGTAVGLTSAQPTELRAKATTAAAGTVELDLVFTQAGSGTVLRSQVTLVVG